MLLFEGLFNLKVVLDSLDNGTLFSFDLQIMYTIFS